MSSRASGAVSKAFAGEVERAFDFLVGEYGLAGPEYQNVVMPVMAFTGSGPRYRIMLDEDDKAVATRVDIRTDSGRLVAELEDLVAAAGLGKREAVAYSAHNLRGLRRALASQAGYVRSLHPLMTTGNAVELMRKARAREWRQ